MNGTLHNSSNVALVLSRIKIVVGRANCAFFGKCPVEEVCHHMGICAIRRDGERRVLEMTIQRWFEYVKPGLTPGES